MQITHAFSNTVGDATGTITIWNGATTSTVAATVVPRPSDWNSQHALQFTLQGNTTNASTVSGTAVQFRGAGGLSIGGSASSLVFSAPAATTLSFFENLPLLNVVTTSLGASTNVVGGLFLPQPVSASFMRLPVSVALTTTSFATGAAGYGGSVAQSNTYWVNLYTMGTGASSESLQYVTGASVTYALQISYSGTASTHSVSYNLTMPTISGGSTTLQLTSSQQSSAVNEVPAGTSALVSVKLFDLPFAASLSAGNYWAALQRSSTTAGSNINMAVLPFCVSQTNIGFGFFGSAGANAAHPQPGVGVWTTNTNGATTSSIALSRVSTSNSHLRPIIQFHRSA